MNVFKTVIMITKEEFLQALEIVNNYKKQVYKQYNEMKRDLDKKDFSHLVITKETLINEMGLSVRARNALMINRIRQDKYKDLKGDSIKIKHFEDLRKKDLQGIRNIGKKTQKEIEKMFLAAGIILK